MSKLFLILLITCSSSFSMTKEELVKAVESSWKVIPQFPETSELLSAKPNAKKLEDKKHEFSNLLKLALAHSNDIVKGKIPADQETALRANTIIAYNENALKFFKDPNMLNRSELEMCYLIFPMIEKMSDMTVEDLFKEGAKAYRKMNDVKDIKADLEIKVLGRQWDWIFTYPGGSQISAHKSKKVIDGKILWSPLPFDKTLSGEKMEKQLINFLTLPVNKIIKLRMTAEAVNHSFAVPAFRVKKDLVPGKESVIWFKAVKEGTYIYTCNEMCGMDHGHMIGYLRVVSDNEYERFKKSLKKLKPTVKIPADKTPTPVNP